MKLVKHIGIKKGLFNNFILEYTNIEGEFESRPHPTMTITPTIINESPHKTTRNSHMEYRGTYKQKSSPPPSSHELETSPTSYQRAVLLLCPVARRSVQVTRRNCPQLAYRTPDFFAT